MHDVIGSSLACSKSSTINPAFLFMKNIYWARGCKFWSLEFKTTVAEHCPQHPRKTLKVINVLGVASFHCLTCRPELVKYPGSGFDVVLLCRWQQAIISPAPARQLTPLSEVRLGCLNPGPKTHSRSAPPTIQSVPSTRTGAPTFSVIDAFVFV